MEQSKTTADPKDVAGRVADQVWTALDRNSCPDIYMKIAHDAAYAATVLAIHRERGNIK